MNLQTGVNIRWPLAALAAALLLATGAGATYLVLRQPITRHVFFRHCEPRCLRRSRRQVLGRPDVVVTLSADAVARAGIAVATVGSSHQTTGFRLPGVVEPNAYRQVVVTPLVSGRITRVVAELGQRVRQGDVMTQIFSPEVEEAHTRYASARADLDAHERELARTEKLVAIGAASRQELERLHAEHTARTADVRSARSRLELLGVPAAALETSSGQELRASADIRAPIDGVVTERLANVGLNVDTTSKLFTVVDLSTVWVVADLYEKDFSRVRVGSPATVTTAAYPDLALEGRVSYIDPQVSAQARTAKLRVEVPNQGNQLRLGMYADVHGRRRGRVRPCRRSRGPPCRPSAIGRWYISRIRSSRGSSPNERSVSGPAAGEDVDVLSGVQPGDSIATEGSFFVRAERERLGLGVPAAQAAAVPAQTQDRRLAAANLQTAKVVVGEQGFEPARLSLRAGTPAQITFVRTTDKTCATEVVFPSLNVTRALPLNQPVVIEFTPAKAGEIAFACGMSMFHGTVVVQ